MIGRPGLLGVLLVAAWQPAAADEPVGGSGPATARESRTLLLTGFEPFGPDRSSNSSWEAIKGLDGTARGGYRIVCERLPVVWGQPLARLSVTFERLQPAAVFAFGQGGDFALETRARARRGAASDNEGSVQAGTAIVAGGPEELSATADCAGLARMLTERGHHVRLSSNAGRYLCEETLYTLEHLKRSRAPRTYVLFSHVPSLAKTGGDLKQIESYVSDVVDCWLAAYAPPAGAVAGPAQAVDPRTASVRAMIDRYFASWSNRQMDVYGSLFLPEAVIQQVNPDGSVETARTREFVAAQTEYQRRRPAKEAPVSVDIRFEQQLARAVVYWKLEAEGAVKYGYDHFTLLKAGNDWKILNLAFYEVQAPAAP